MQTRNLYAKRNKIFSFGSKMVLGRFGKPETHIHILFWPNLKYWYVFISGVKQIGKRNSWQYMYHVYFKSK